MKALLVGNERREHTLTRTPVRTSNTERPVWLPVQAGDPSLETLSDSFVFTTTESDEILTLAKAHGVELVVVDLEIPLVAGVVNILITAGIPCFGLALDTARLGTSRSFAKDVIAEAGTAAACSFTHRNMNEIDTAFQELGALHVVEDDILAAGKEAIVIHNVEGAHAHTKSCLGCEDSAVVIEDCFSDPEVSLLCLCDGTSVVSLAPAQDFKRAGDASSGSSTGGMDAYSSFLWLDEGIVEEIVRSVAQPAVNAMAKHSTLFVGLPHRGLAMASGDIQVVEFSVRLGDPKAQAALECLGSSLVGFLHVAITGTFGQVPTPQWSTDATVTVVMASGGYLGSSNTDHEIVGIDKTEAVSDIHAIRASTSWKTVSLEDTLVPAGSGPEAEEILVDSGGCVLNVIGRATTVQAACTFAYEDVKQISFVGEHHRSDITTWPVELDLSIGSDLKD